MQQLTVETADAPGLPETVFGYLSHYPGASPVVVLRPGLPTATSHNTIIALWLAYRHVAPPFWSKPFALIAPSQAGSSLIFTAD